MVLFLIVSIITLPWSEISSHYESLPIGTLVSAESSIGLYLDDLRIQQTQYDGWILHHLSPLVLAFSHLLKLDIFEIDRPISVQLFLPLLEKGLEHQDLVVADLCLRVYLGKFSVGDIGVTFLGPGFLIDAFIVLGEVFLEVDSLLEPVVASPTHGYLIKVFKK